MDINTLVVLRLYARFKDTSILAEACNEHCREHADYFLWHQQKLPQRMSLQVKFSVLRSILIFCNDSWDYKWTPNLNLVQWKQWQGPSDVLLFIPNQKVFFFHIIILFCLLLYTQNLLLICLFFFSKTKYQTKMG